LYREVLMKRWGKSVPHGRFPRLVERLFEDAGLPAPVHEHPIGPYRVDFAYVALKIAHGDDRQLQDPLRHPCSLPPNRRFRIASSSMGLDLTPDELLSTTRAVRKRLDFERAVPLDVVRECIEVATQAPTGSNQQGWHWVV